MREAIPKDVYEIFEDTLKKALRTKSILDFRLCIDAKDNISVAKPATGFFPVCPPDTKKIVDVVIKPNH